VRRQGRAEGLIHGIDLPAAYQVRCTSDVLKGTLRRSCVEARVGQESTCALLNRPDGSNALTSLCDRSMKEKSSSRNRALPFWKSPIH
jgi:hypothetical protein